VAFIENNQIVVQRAANNQTIAHLRDVPITFNGTLGFMVENALAATLAAATFGVAAATISAALKSFYPSVAQTPGRMNIFDVQGSKVLVDFAHNPDGFAGIRDFLASIKSPFKIGIIVGTGDRKDDDMRELGRISAQMFDLTLIHQTKFLRGKTAEELVDLLVQGVHQHNKNARWMRIPDAEEPLAFALNLAKPNSYITALSEVLTDFPELIERYR
jgi:cyanophycin synthetase